MEAIIYLGLQLPANSCDLPKASAWLALALQRAKASLLLILLRIGFTEPIRYRIAGELLPHRFSLTSWLERSLCLTP